jgi:tRNA U34 5-methylaminomethyl-2-thiouridine-forming methyltransferase MnmC
MPEFELVTVASGAKSLRSVEFGQTFHPVTGPKVEAVALHVVQQRLAERAAAARPFVIWDVGFGAAANAIAAIEALSAQPGLEVQLHSFDKSTAPIEFALGHAAALGYIVPHESALRALLAAGRADIVSPAGTRMEWRLHIGDFREQMTLPDIAAPRSILYDPYSPSANPDMWSLEHFTALRARLADDVPCLWTNYTRSTAVRVTLLLAGFFVGEGCAIGGKDATTVASNALKLVERPLDRAWLERVARSTNSAPLRGQVFTQVPISADDLELLRRHAQFMESGGADKTIRTVEPAKK